MSAVKALMSARPVAYYPELARAVGGIAPALFFQQIAHWQGKNPDGWVYRTQEELVEELAMSPKVQQSAREHLVKRKLLEEKRDGMPRRLYYRPIWDNLEAALQTLPSASTDYPDGQVQTIPSGDTTLKNSNESNTPTGEVKPSLTRKNSGQTPEANDYYIAYLYNQLDERELLEASPITSDYKSKLAGHLTAHKNKGARHARILFTLDRIRSEWTRRRLPFTEAWDDTQPDNVRPLRPVGSEAHDKPSREGGGLESLSEKMKRLGVEA